jgi:4-coumarate--CoA ligase
MLSQVSPTELEEELRQMEGIADVAVGGIADDAFGEVPRAYVVKKPDSNITDEEISKYLKARVADFKQLRGGVCFVKEIPRSAAGKIIRKDLKEV